MPLLTNTTFSPHSIPSNPCQRAVKQATSNNAYSSQKPKTPPFWEAEPPTAYSKCINHKHTHKNNALIFHAKHTAHTQVSTFASTGRRAANAATGATTHGNAPIATPSANSSFAIPSELEGDGAGATAFGAGAGATAGQRNKKKMLPVTGRSRVGVTY